MTLPFHLKGFEKVERAHIHEFLYSKRRNRNARKLSIFGSSAKEISFWGGIFFSFGCAFFFFLVRQENEKAIIHAVLINHAFTSCWEVISQSETLAQTAAACVY